MWTNGPSLWGLQSVDPYFADVVLLLHADGTDGSTTIIDSSSRAITVTASGDAKLSTTQKEYGTASMVFDGTADWVQTATYGAPIPATGTGGTFCLEGWFYVNDTGVTRTIAGMWDTAGTPVGWQVDRLSSNKLAVFIGNSSVAFYRITGTTTVTANVWHHFALVRDGTAMRLYLDGVQEGTYTGLPSGSQNWNYGITLNFVLVGAYRNTSDVHSQIMNGYIDEVRLTFGDPRYPSGTTFTPAGPFPDA